MTIPNLIDNGGTVIIAFAGSQKLTISVGDAAILSAKLLDFLQTQVPEYHG